MKTPQAYKRWLKKVQEEKEIEYTLTDESAFEMELNNYNLLYHLYKKMTEDKENIENNLMMYITSYNQLMRLHNKFLEIYGLGGYDKLKKQYMKKKIDVTEKEKTSDDILDKFLCD
jgi:hypothetical protein